MIVSNVLRVLNRIVESIAATNRARAERMVHQHLVRAGNAQ